MQAFISPQPIRMQEVLRKYLIRNTDALIVTQIEKNNMILSAVPSAIRAGWQGGISGLF